MQGVEMSKKQGLGGFWAASASGLAVVMLGLTDCGGDSSSQATSRAPATSQSPTAGPVAANLLQVCDHAQDAFRDGDLGDAEQAKALSFELQGMIDVAKPDAARVLHPMIEAADAVGADGRHQARPALRRAEQRAYGTLRRLCVRAGSEAWGG
jgi:hypothetical protein